MRRAPSISLSISVLCSITLITACSPPEVSGTAIVQTEEGTSQEITRTAQNIAERFDEILPTARSTVSATVNDNTITFTFRGAVPPEGVLRPLAMTRGVLRIAPADQPGETWVSDADVEDVQLFTTDQGRFIALRLTQEAGGRLMAATSANTGRALIMTWDGRTLMSATIQAPFGQSFQFNAPSSDQDAHVLLNALRRGHLPVVTKSFEYRDARPRD